MHEMADIGKTKIPKYVVAKGFNACMFEVVKVYCYYPVKILPGDSVRVFKGNAFCDFIVELPFSSPSKFKRERIEEKDWWLFDITLQRTEPNRTER